MTPRLLPGFFIQCDENVFFSVGESGDDMAASDHDSGVGRAQRSSPPGDEADVLSFEEPLTFRPTVEVRATDVWPFFAAGRCEDEGEHQRCKKHEMGLQ